MVRKLLKTVFIIVVLVLTLSPSAMALEPQDALSSRPEKSAYVTLRMDNLSGLLQSIFSPANIEMLASFAGPEEAQGIRLIGSLASQIPAKTVAAAVGMGENSAPFMQVAASMPSSARAKLKHIADGKASRADLVTLLMGDSALMFAMGEEPKTVKGAKGTYCVLDNTVAFAAKDDLLLIAIPPAEIDASLDALSKKANRLSLKRRFESPNYYYMHLDMPTVAKIAGENSTDKGADIESVVSMFKAPFNVEMAFESKPKSVLMSAYANLSESLADPTLKELKPTAGANFFQAGGGKLFFALSSPLRLRMVDWKGEPQLMALYNEVLKNLEKIGITEKEVEDLLNGSFSVAWGSESTILGRRAPGGYLALTGSNGAAAKILGKLVGNEAFSQAVPMAPLKTEGWDSLFMVDQALSPVPLLVGVSKETLFLGALDAGSVSKKPEFPAEAAYMSKEPLIGGAFIDLAGIWGWLRQEAADPESFVSAGMSSASAMTEDAATLAKNVLEAELAIPFIKWWGPDAETGFMEFSFVDVPEGKRLLPRLVEAAGAFNTLGLNDEESEEEEDAE